MSLTIGNYTWEDVYGLTLAKDGTNIGIRCYTYLTATQGYGDCIAFFNISYMPTVNNKLRVTINNIQVYQNEWTTRNWILSGNIKVNGATLFSGSVSTPDGIEYNQDTKHTISSAHYYVDIDYPNSQGSLALNYEFRLYFKTDIYVNSWKGWTNSSEETVSGSYTYYHAHSWSSTVTKQPTCTTTGVRTYTCSGCENTYTEPIAMLGHSYIDATCTAPKTCSVCGGTDGEPLGHNWDSGAITTPSTYEATGIKTHTCLRCSETKEETLDKLIVSVYIDNGETLDEYSIYIDDGEEWYPYILYIDDGEKFVAYC